MIDCNTQVQFLICAFWLVLVVCTVVFLVTMVKLFFSDRYTKSLEEQIKEYRDAQKKHEES